MPHLNVYHSIWQSEQVAQVNMKIQIIALHGKHEFYLDNIAMQYNTIFSGSWNDFFFFSDRSKKIVIFSYSCPKHRLWEAQ